jgi:glycosyltransferase involved in cell wall biosynthesis
VVIPAFNEEELIERVAMEMLQVLRRRNLPSFEVVLVDDGSRDGTRAKMEALEARHAEVRVAVHETNRGLGAALGTGFRACRGEVVTWVPGDGQFDPKEVLDGLKALDDHDIVLVFRIGRSAASRSVISFCAWTLMRVLFGFDATDFSGIFLIRRALLEEMAPRAEEVFFNLELALRCRQKKKRLGKIMAGLRPREAGYSKVANTRTIIRNTLALLLFRLRF